MKAKQAKHNSVVVEEAKETTEWTCQILILSWLLEYTNGRNYFPTNTCTWIVINEHRLE